MTTMAERLQEARERHAEAARVASEQLSSAVERLGLPPMCGAFEGMCACAEGKTEHEVHRCRCGGSWSYEDGNRDLMVVHTWPGSAL